METPSQERVCASCHINLDCNCYQYSPLPEYEWTRIAAVRPYLNHRDEPIEITLNNVNLYDPDHRDYVAISYAWAGQSPTEPITCESREMRVTPTLLAALRSIRKHGEIVYVWVDAICIDQSQSIESLQERQAQVSMMNVIFSEALCVIVHLGETLPEDVELAQDIKKFAKIEYADYGYKLSMAEIYDRALQDLSKYDLPDLESMTWQRIEQLFAKPWFNRLWVVQEYALARKVYFLLGNEHLEADDFQSGIVNASRYYNLLNMPLMERISSTGFTSAETLAMWVPRYSRVHGFYTHIKRMQQRLRRMSLILKSFTSFFEIVRMRTRHESNKRPPELMVNRSAIRIGIHQRWPVISAPPWWMWSWKPFSKRLANFFRYYNDTHQFRATQSRDRVYALKGLCSEEHAPELAVDYIQTAARLAEQVTLYLIRQGHAVFMISTRSLSAKQGRDGWRAALRHDDIYIIESLTGFVEITGKYKSDLFQAGGSGQADVRILSGKPQSNVDHSERDNNDSVDQTTQSPQISVTGICIGKLDDVCPVEFPEAVMDILKGQRIDEKSWWEGMRYQFKWYFEGVAWLNATVNWISSSKHNTRDSFELDCWNAMSCGLSFNDKGQRELIGSRPDLFNPGIAVLGCKEAYQSQWTLWWKHFNKNVSLPWEHLCMSYGYSLATDSSGRICNVPLGSTRDDLVCIFQGFPLPFVLRPTEDGTSHMLLGACYIQGAMDGTLFDEVSKKGSINFVLQSGSDNDEERERYA